MPNAQVYSARVPDPLDASAPLTPARPAIAIAPPRITTMAAFLAPAAVVALRAVKEIRSPAGARATTSIALLLAVGWMLAALTRPVRDTLYELGKVLLERVGTSAFVLATLASLVLATALADELLPTAVAAALAVGAVAAAQLALARSPRRFLFELVVLLATGVLVVAADTYVRLVQLPSKSHNRVLGEFDPILGWKLRPSLEVVRKTDGYTARETIGRLGFRTKDRPFEKPAGTRRVVVLGDSFTEGYTVNDGETYVDELELALSRAVPAEAISLGVGGYSTDQELLSYVHYGRSFAPDVVVLQFCPNDVPFATLDTYAHRGHKPVFVRHGDALFLHGVPVPDRKTSGLLSSDLKRLSAIALVLDDLLAGLAFRHDVRAASDDPDENWRVIDLLLRDLDRLVRSDGAKLVVFNAILGDREVDERLPRILALRSIPYIDTAPAYRGDPASYHVPEDGHWNRKGHEAIGRLLAREIEALGLLAGAAPVGTASSGGERHR